MSIIIPNYNHAKFLQKRLDTIINQTYQNFEVIILDDASTDRSIDILKTYKNHEKISHFIVNTQNSGSPFKQWFKGISVARGDYIWIAESDDFASPLFLEKVLGCFNRSYAPDVVFVGTTNVDANNNDIGNTTRIERKYEKLLEKDFNMAGKEFLNYFMPDYCIIRNVSSAVFKKSLLSEKAKKVITYKTIGDFYFWVHLCLENYRFTYMSEKLNFMRKHEGTVRNNAKKMTYRKKEYRLIHRVVLLRKWFNYALIKKIIIYNIKSVVRKA
ncbi:glycosyltransferase [Aestuariivivens sediminicola]|uniref:glycosyltransferase n=1 Tax=Aestuariivivens sediminicola TaxID=2913560 RepID=UPI001F5982EB